MGKSFCCGGSLQWMERNLVLWTFRIIMDPIATVDSCWETMMYHKYIFLSSAVKMHWIPQILQAVWPKTHCCLCTWTSSSSASRRVTIYSLGLWYRIILHWWYWKTGRGLLSLPRFDESGLVFEIICKWLGFKHSASSAVPWRCS